jgi:hypothetical protein
MQENPINNDPLGILGKEDPLGILKKKDGGVTPPAGPSPAALQRLEELKKQLNENQLKPQRTELPREAKQAQVRAESIKTKEEVTPKVTPVMFSKTPTFKVEYPEQDELTAKVLGFQSAQQRVQFQEEDQQRNQENAQKAADEFYNTGAGKLYYNLFKPLADAGARAIGNTGATVSRLAGEDKLANAIVDRFTPEKRYEGTIAGNKPTKLQGGLFNDGKMDMAKLPSTIVRGLADMAWLIAPAGGVSKIGQAAGLSEKVATGTGLIANSFLQTREDYYQEGKASGLKGDALDNFATGAAGLTSALEAVFPNTIAMGGFKSKMAKEYAKQIASGITAKAALKAGAKEVLKEALVKEPLQEVTQLVGDKVARTITDMTTGENNFGDQFDWEKGKDELYETLVITPIISAFAAGSGAIRNYTPTNYEKALFYDASKNPQQVNQFLDNKFIEKEITEDQYKQAKQKFASYNTALEQVKNLGYSEDQTLQMAWELFSGKEKLPVNQSVVADPILKDALGTEIKKDKETISENIKSIGMGIPSVGSDIEGKELSFVISNIGDKGAEIGQGLVDQIGDDTYRVEEVSVKDIYDNNPEFKNYVDSYKKGSINSEAMLVPAVLKDNSIVDGRARLAEQYLSGKERVKVFKNISNTIAQGQVLEDQFTQPKADITGQGTIVTLAPFYNTTVSNTTDAKKVRETPEYKQYFDSIPTVAKALGLDVEIVNETIGGFVNSAGEKITEVSNKIFVANGTIDQAEEFGAIMGTMTPETQEATIAARYVNEQEEDSVPADEYVEEIGIKVGDIDGALESLREAGIFDFTVDEDKKTVSILDFSRGEDVAFDNNIANFVSILKGKNISYGKEGRRPVNSRYIGPSRRTEILERIAGDAIRLQQGGENLRSIISEARRRNQKFGEEEVARQDRNAQLETKLAEELRQDLVSDPISKAAQSLKSTGVSIDLVEDPAEYDTMVQQLGGQRGTEGVFLSNNGKILLNKSKLNDAITAGRIVWHESSHPIVNIIRNTNPELYNRVISGMKSSDNPAVQQAIAWANQNYQGEGVIDDESIVEAIAMVADGTLDLNKVSTDLKQSIIDFINLIARAFGLGQVRDTDVQEFKNLASQIADALTSGRDIAEVVGQENVKATENQLAQLRISSADIAKRTEDKTIDGFVQPSMILMGKQKGQDVELYSGPASIEDLKRIKPDMYVSRAEELTKSALVQGKVRAYPSTASMQSKLKWADNVYAKAKDTVVSNLLYIYDAIPSEIRDISKLWYDGANIIAQELAEKYNTTLEQASAVIASQSPQKPWYDNVHLAHFVMDFYANKNDMEFTKEMYDYYALKSQPTKQNPAGYPKQIQYLPTLEKAVGKKFSELSNYDKSVMIRADFDNNYERRAPLRIPTGVIVGRVNSMSSFSGYDTIAKAVSILENGSEKNISDNLGKAFKVRNFNNNISKPRQDAEVTIDTHAMAAAYMLPLGSKSPEVKFDEATYAFFADAYRDAASKRGVLAREMQSIVWEGVRSVFPASDKSEANKAKAREIWSNYKNGSLTLNDVQEQIKANGKDLSITDWSRFTDRLLEEDGKSSYLEELPLAGGNQPATGLRDGSSDSRRVSRMGERSLQAGAQFSVGNRLAPNGKPSKLTEAQYNQVRTPEFKNWFGDWENDPANASKVVDENGEPLVVYHGTSKDKDFNKFNVSDRGAWFTSDPKEASSYAVENDNMRSKFDFYTGERTDQNTSSRVLPVFLNIKKLYKYETDVSQEDRRKLMYAKSYRSVQREIFRRLYSDAFNSRQQKESGVDMGAGIYVALGGPNQIKSASGNRGTFSTTDDKVQASVGNRDIINGFYSPIEDRINTFKQPKASVQKWKEIVGVKSDEAVFSGLADWLGGMKPDRQLSKEEVLQFIKDNRIEINEVVKGKGGKMTQVQMDDVYNGVREQLAIMDMIDDVDSVKNNPLDVWYNNPTDENYDQLGDFLEDRGIDLNFIADAENDGTKYSQYQLPGGENYKEVLITLPGKEENLFKEWFKNKYGSDTTSFDDSFIRTAREQYKYSAKPSDTSDSPSFKSSHFDEANIITHLRMNTRTDADGKKVLFLEEVQSDWGQKGKREGFINDIVIKSDPKLNGFFAAYDKSGERLPLRYNGESVSALKTEDKVREALIQNPPSGLVTSAPYVTNTNAWVKLGLKVALKEAVRQGADRIAWTTGEQQNARYDLSKSIKRVDFIRIGDNRYKYEALDLDGKRIAYDDNGTTSLQEIEDMFGKDIAEKVKADKAGDLRLQGDGLKVGGKGMKAFYGDAKTLGIVGNVAKALVKELTGKEGSVVESKISTPVNQDVIDRYNRARQYGNVPEALAKEYEQATGLQGAQPAIDITPELKASVQGGIPQFSVGNRPENNANFKLGAFVMRKKADGATDGEIAIAIASVTGMKPEDIKKLIDNPEQYIRDSFPSMSKLQQDNLIQKAKIQNIYRGRQFGKPIDKAFTGLEVPKEKIDEYMRKTAGADNFVKEWAKDFNKNWLDPARGLPNWVLEIKDFASGTKNIEVARAAKTIERLKAQAKKIGFEDWGAFSKALVVAKDVKRFIPNEDGIVPFDAGVAAAGRMFTTPDDQLPSLVPAEIKALPQEIIPFVYAMRGQIDNLTRDLIGYGYVSPEQAVTLENNLGQYVNRAYRMYNEMRYKPEKEVYHAAVKFLADQYIKQIATDKAGVVSYEEVQNEAIEKAKKEVEGILNKKKNPYFNAKTERRNTGILEQRKDIPEPMRKLMGEYTDPGTVFMMTVAKQAALKASSEYLTKLRENGMGTLFFEENDPSRTASHSVQIASTGTESMSPLGGLFTTPEIAEALETVEPTYNELTNTWMKLVGAVRWGKTVGSIGTQFKNFESNTLFAVLNGMLLSGKNTKAFGAAAKYVKGQYSAKEIDDITEKTIKLNLVGQSVGMRELKTMLGSGDINDIALDISLSPDGKWGKKVAKNLNVFREANKLYRLGDDFWKVYAYINEREQMSDARFGQAYDQLTPEQQEQIDVESSERVKSTWPTYDRVVEAAKFVSKRAPIFGNFISFQAESLRVLANSIKIAREDLKDPKTAHLGVRRIAGITAYFGLRSAITIGVAKLTGFAAAGILGAAFGDDEEERNKKAIQEALPTFMRTGELFPIRTKEPHRFVVVNMSSLDPYGIIPNSLNAFTEGREGIFKKTMDPGVGAAAAELFSAFLEPEMTFKTMWSVMNNIDPKTKQDIVMSTDTDGQALAKVASKVWDQLEPSSVALVKRFYEREDKEAELLAIFGARPYDVDLHKSFGYILSQFGRDVDAINTEYNKIKFKDLPQADKDAAERAAEDKKAFAISKVNEIYRNFINIGADPEVLDQLINQRSPIKVTGFDKNTKDYLKTGDIKREELFKGDSNKGLKFR